jgi:hypothetical protein
LLLVATVVAGLALYSSLSDDTEVLVLRETVLAGEQLTTEDLRVVAVSSQDDVAWVRADQRSMVVGQYARYRLAEGGFLTADAVQPERLVTPGRVLMSVEVPAGQVPVGLRERSEVVLVVTGPGGSDATSTVVNAVVAAVPRDLATVIEDGGDAGRDVVALSVEVPAEMVTTVGTAAAVSVGVLDGSIGPEQFETAAAELSATEPAAQVQPAASPTTTAPAAGPTTTAAPPQGEAG